LSIVGQAVAELHLGRLPEAEAALTAALEKYPTDAELIANTIVLNVLAGKPSADLESYVHSVEIAPSSALPHT
jgi:coatomer protein complex subunit epsilon